MSDVLLDAHFDLVPVSKPRPANNRVSWHVRAKTFKVFRDEMHFMLGQVEKHAPKVDPPYIVEIMFFDWRWNADPENWAGGILDSLKPWPLPDDSFRYIESLRVSRCKVKQDGGGFRVTVRGAS